MKWDTLANGLPSASGDGWDLLILGDDEGALWKGRCHRYKGSRYSATRATAKAEAEAWLVSTLKKVMTDIADAEIQLATLRRIAGDAHKALGER